MSQVKHLTCEVHPHQANHTRGTAMSARTQDDTSTEVQEREYTVSETVLDEVAGAHERFALQRQEGVVSPMVLADVLGIKPQMVYTYISKGKIATVTRNNTQKKTIALSEARRFAREYLQHKVDRAEKQRIQDELVAASETE